VPQRAQKKINIMMRRLQSRSFLSTFAIDQGLAPRIHQNAWIAPTAVVVGDVELGNFASVWWHAVVRGDRDLIKVGDRSNIQDGSCLHTDAGIVLSIGKGCTVGHMAKLHGCTVKDNSLIGIGATILNNAVIGENCLIGANALISEGKEIPPKSLVMGVNKIIRELTDTEIEGLKRTAEGYVQNQQRYRRTLVPTHSPI